MGERKDVIHVNSLEVYYILDPNKAPTTKLTREDGRTHEDICFVMGTN